MTGLKIALLFGCLALVAGRTITVQKTALSLTEDSEDADKLSDILRTVLSFPDVISGQQYGDIVQGCSKGKCEFCKKIMKLNACFVATLQKNSVVLEVTINKKQIFKTVIKGPNPPKVCKKSIPHLPSVTDVCLEVKNINLKEASGCVYISFKIKGIKTSHKIGCFKIPTSDGSNQELETEQEDFELQDTGAAYREDTVVTFESLNETA